MLDATDLPPMENTGRLSDTASATIRRFLFIRLRSNCPGACRDMDASLRITFPLFELGGLVTAAEDKNFTPGFFGADDLGQHHIQGVEKAVPR